MPLAGLDAGLGGLVIVRLPERGGKSFICEYEQYISLVLGPFKEPAIHALITARRRQAQAK